MAGIPRFVRARDLERRAPIRLRVALAAAAMALIAFGALGYLQLSSTSDAFNGVARDQAETLTRQLATALVGADSSVSKVIPFTPRGLDGVAIFDRSGRARIRGGALGATLAALGPQAARVIQSRRTLSEFRIPRGGGQSDPEDGIDAWSPSSTVEVTIMPQADGGAVAAGFHVGWATESLRSRAYANVLSLAGGVLFIAFGLMLLLGRVVTAPVARLADEVRRLGEDDLQGSLSEQHSPELQQLASDISQMRDDLLDAVRESSTDPLTGIANHRAFQERLEEAVAHTGKTGEPLALIAVDLDKLKSVNDRWGHAAGDRFIQAVSRRLSECCREGDLCARVGGDEFAVICPSLSREGADALAARMADAVRTLRSESLLGSAGVDLSVSVGVGDMPRGAATLDQLVRQADTALYESKNHPATPASASASASAPAAADQAESEKTVRALAVAVDAKDSGTRSHCDTVAGYAVAIARRLGFDEPHIAAVRRAALLHDVGKIGTPDAVLLKPARLTEDEFDVMKRHSTLGYRIVMNGALPAEEAIWILHHHEHFDGSGYPHGLRGDEIPIESRILLVADAFEAMTSTRPYREGRPVEAAAAELRRCAGTQFDPAVVSAFLTTLEPGAEELPAELFDRVLRSGSETAS